MSAVSIEAMSLVSLLPPLTDEEYAALRESIAAQGVLVPVLVAEDGVIIDGHHRSQIATELEIDCPRETVAGLDEDGRIELALAVNAARRQLSREARVALACSLRRRGWTLERVARSLGVATDTAHRWTSDVSEIGNVTDSLGRRQPARKPREKSESPRYPEVAQFGVPEDAQQTITDALDGMPDEDRQESLAKIRGEQGSHERKNTMAVLAGMPPMPEPETPQEGSEEAVRAAVAALDDATAAIERAQEFELTKGQLAAMAAALERAEEALQ